MRGVFWIRLIMIVSGLVAMFDGSIRSWFYEGFVREVLLVKSLAGSIVVFLAWNWPVREKGL